MVGDNPSMEVDGPSNSSIALSSDGVSVEFCSSNEDNTAVVMINNIVVTEDVQYFSSRPTLITDEDDTTFSSVYITCPPIIDHQSLTHSLTQESSNHNTEHYFSILLLTIKIPLYRVIVSTRWRTFFACVLRM